MVDITTLQEIPLFDGLNEKQLKKIQRTLKTQTVDAETTVIRDGEKGHELFVMLQGEVQISKPLTSTLPRNDRDQRDKSIIRLDSNGHAFFGEMALLDPNCIRMATVTATRKSVFAVLRRDDFDNLIKEDEHLGYILIRNIAKILSMRLGKANQDIMKLTVAFSLALER